MGEPLRCDELGEYSCLAELAARLTEGALGQRHDGDVVVAGGGELDVGVVPPDDPLPDPWEERRVRPIEVLVPAEAVQRLPPI